MYWQMIPNLIHHFQNPNQLYSELKPQRKMMDYWNLSLMFVVLFPSVGLVASAHHIMFFEASGDQTGCKQANQIIQSTLFGRSARSEPTACAQDPKVRRVKAGAQRRRRRPLNCDGCLQRTICVITSQFAFIFSSKWVFLTWGVSAFKATCEIVWQLVVFDFFFLFLKLWDLSN